MVYIYRKNAQNKRINFNLYFRCKSSKTIYSDTNDTYLCWDAFDKYYYFGQKDDDNVICWSSALLNYLTIRITLDKYEKKSCIWRTLEQHNIINNPKNCNEIRQTMVAIHKLHLSINAVNSILMFNSNSITTEKERAHNNYYNYWI